MKVDDDELEEDLSDPASILQQHCMFCVKNVLQNVRRQVCRTHVSSVD